MSKTIIRSAFLALTVAALAACSSIPAPTAEMAVAQSTVQRVSTVPQVTAYAPVELQHARDLWSKAERAMEKKDYVEARRYAELAEGEARLAESKAEAAENDARLKAVQRGIQQAQPAR